MESKVFVIPSPGERNAKIYSMAYKLYTTNGLVASDVMAIMKMIGTAINSFYKDNTISEAEIDAAVNSAIHRAAYENGTTGLLLLKKNIIKQENQTENGITKTQQQKED